MQDTDITVELDNESLIADLVEWIGSRARTYDEVMQVWQTSCPRLTIWEDAVDAGLVRQAGHAVSITNHGRSFLKLHGRRSVSAPGSTSGAPSEAP